MKEAIKYLETKRNSLRQQAEGFLFSAKQIDEVINGLVENQTAPPPVKTQTRCFKRTWLQHEDNLLLDFAKEGNYSEKNLREFATMLKRTVGSLTAHSYELKHKTEGEDSAYFEAVAKRFSALVTIDRKFNIKKETKND